MMDIPCPPALSRVEPDVDVGTQSSAEPRPPQPRDDDDGQAEDGLDVGAPVEAPIGPGGEVESSGGEDDPSAPGRPASHGGRDTGERTDRDAEELLHVRRVIDVELLLGDRKRSLATLARALAQTPWWELPRLGDLTLDLGLLAVVAEARDYLGKRNPQAAAALLAGSPVTSAWCEASPEGAATSIDELPGWARSRLFGDAGSPSDDILLRLAIRTRADLEGDADRAQGATSRLLRLHGLAQLVPPGSELAARWVDGLGEAIAQPCQRDLLSIDGMRALAERTPDRWRVLLRCGLPAATWSAILAGKSVEATVEQVLLRFSPALLPKAGSGISAEVCRRTRLVLREVIGIEGDRLACEVHAEELERLRARLRSGPRSRGRRPMSPEMVSRGMTAVVAALHRWRDCVGLPPLPALARAEAAPRRPPRWSQGLADIQILMWRAAPLERIALALAVGLGLGQCDIDGLVVGDRRFRQMTFEEMNHLWGIPAPVYFTFLRVRDRRDPRLVRWIPMPEWVSELIAAVCPLPEDPTAPLLPRARVASLRSILCRVQQDVPARARIRPSDLRTTWQGVAHRVGCSREVIRGTWRQADAPETKQFALHHAHGKLASMVSAWRTLCGTPEGERMGEMGAALAYKSVPVPRRARSHCRASDPELSARGRERPAPLPPSVAYRPPPPGEPV